MKEDKQKQCITCNMKPESLSELTMFFIDAFNKLVFSSDPFSLLVAFSLLTDQLIQIQSEREAILL